MGAAILKKRNPRSSQGFDPLLLCILRYVILVHQTWSHQLQLSHCSFCYLECKFSLEDSIGVRSRGPTGRFVDILVSCFFFPGKLRACFSSIFVGQSSCLVKHFLWTEAFLVGLFWGPISICCREAKSRGGLGVSKIPSYKGNKELYPSSPSPKDGREVNTQNCLVYLRFIFY